MACAGCLGGLLTDDGPEAVASSYVAAYDEGDRDELRPFVHDDSEYVPPSPEVAQRGGVSVQSTEAVERTEAHAKVDVVYTVDLSSEPYERRLLLELRPQDDEWRVWDAVSWDGEPFELTVLSFLRALDDGAERASTLLHPDSDLSETLEQRRSLFESVDLSVVSTSVHDSSGDVVQVDVRLSLTSDGVSSSARPTVHLERADEEWRIVDYERWPAGPEEVAHSFLEALSEGDVETAGFLVHFDSPIEDRVEAFAATLSSVDFTVESSELVERERHTATVEFEFSVRSSDGRRPSEHTVDLRTEFLEWNVWDYQ